MMEGRWVIEMLYDHATSSQNSGFAHLLDQDVCQWCQVISLLARVVRLVLAAAPAGEGIEATALDQLLGVMRYEALESLLGLEDMEQRYDTP
jgi:hypothetical protein